MRQLLPTLVDPVDPLEVYPGAGRPAPQGRPWLMVNMVASADGAIEVDGVSGGLGGPADRHVFRAVRATADWIVAGAGTVRAERYGLPRLPADARTLREAQGRPPNPGLAVVTGSLDLGPDLPLFAERESGDPEPLIITGEGSPRSRVDALEELAEVVVVDGARPTPDDVLGELHRRGARVVLAEGGPSFNGQLAAAGLVDELCLSVSPLLVGGPSTRIVTTTEAMKPLSLRLAHLLEEDGMLFTRYVRE